MGKQEIRSPCHHAALWSSLVDGVYAGSCSACFAFVVRLNPRTGEVEWLDGEPPWTTKPLRPMGTPRAHDPEPDAPAEADPAGPMGTNGHG